MSQNLESDELFQYISFAIGSALTSNALGSCAAPTSNNAATESKSKDVIKLSIANSERPTRTDNDVVEIASLPDADDAADEGEKYFDPVTGAPISKNAFKKLQKGVVKKDKKDKVPHAPKPTGDAAITAKKEKKKAKEPEVIYIDATTPGEKKILEGIFPATYQPKYVEAAWQAWWEKCGFYRPDVTRGLSSTADEKFVMVIPPPNVTGSLHLGHALTTAIEDTITRFNRMKGKVTLWVPGTDHAGIATQSVVEKRLKKDEGLSRHDLGRDKFIERVWEWKTQYGGKICNQIRCLGASVDWTRESFTMDSNLSRAVTEAFVRFHEDGLLYRDTRLINWSCALQSAISDIEVEYKELEGRTFLPVPGHKLKDKYEFGMITSFAYKVISEEGSTSIDSEEIVVATTRLETMLGDSAVAVHPDDPRYTHLHGKMLKHPFVNRLIPVITDGELVDMSFGTGAVKVTPAHDPNDYLCGKRNELEFIIVLAEDGSIAANGGEFAGMMRYDARLAMEERLKSLGLFRGKEPNKMRLGLCQRSGDIIEPMLTPQWYVNCTSMAARSIEAVRIGQLKIVPSSLEATWFRWLENIRDWCVSRQLWWGHRIPAYFARRLDEPLLDRNDPANSSRWVVARSPVEAMCLAETLLGVPAGNIRLDQDEDVLDTWFSSGLFPFSVFGWPEQTDDFKAFYPTTLLETGQDILFFWVARMVMMGLHLTNKLPFTTVYLHSMVRDKYGRKMSKSLGNVVDPLEVINGCGLEDLLRKIQEGNLPVKEVEKALESQRADFPEGIPECGADALRFGLLAYTNQTNDINLDIKRVVGYRQFCNKMWNAVRFALTYLTQYIPTPTAHIEVVTDPHVSRRDLYVLSRLNGAIQRCNQHTLEYSFGAVADTLHDFFLHDVCDLYLELVKPVVQSGPQSHAQLTASEGESDMQTTPETDGATLSPSTAGAKRCAQTTLFTVLEHYLRLCHPLMPFVTEELWQRLPGLSSLTDRPSIMISPYPVPNPAWFRPEAEATMDIVKDAIHAARSLRADYRIANHVKGTFFFRTTSAETLTALSEQADDFCTLAKGASLVHLPPEEETPPGCCLRVLSASLTLLLSLAGIVNVEQELQRLGKEVERLLPMVDQYQRKIAAPGFDKVPEEVRVSTAEKLSAYESELRTTNDAIDAFKKFPV